MTEPMTRIVNIGDVALDEIGDSGKFQLLRARLGPMVGSTGLGCTLTAVPPGKRSYPFHRHHVTHEMFFILSGAGEYRLDERTLPLRQAI